MAKSKNYYIVEDLKIEVTIIGKRNVYGRDEVEITPVAGSGSKWVRLEGLVNSDPKEIKDKTV